MFKAFKCDFMMYYAFKYNVFAQLSNILHN